MTEWNDEFPSKRVKGALYTILDSQFNAITGVLAQSDVQEVWHSKTQAHQKKKYRKQTHVVLLQ